MDHQSYINEMTFRDYLRILFRQKAIIILCFLVVSAVSFVGLTLKTPVYHAQVKMLISAEKQVEAPYYQELTPGQRNVQASVTQSEVVTASPVTGLVIIGATAPAAVPMTAESASPAPRFVAALSTDP